MPANMYLKEETSTKMVFETDSSGHKWKDFLHKLVTPLFVFAGILFSCYFWGIPTWLNWMVAVIAIIVEINIIIVIYSQLVDITVIIDLNTQRVTRIQNSFLKRSKTSELNLNQIRRVLIHCEGQGHGSHCKLLLESSNNPPLEIDSFTASILEMKKVLGNKIGTFLWKPVVLKITDRGIPISQTTIQF